MESASSSNEKVFQIGAIENQESILFESNNRTKNKGLRKKQESRGRN